MRVCHVGGYASDYVHFRMTTLEGWNVLVITDHEEAQRGGAKVLQYGKFADHEEIKNLHLDLNRKTCYVNTGFSDNLR
jgi:hypothetical protein